MTIAAGRRPPNLYEVTESLVKHLDVLARLQLRSIEQSSETMALLRGASDAMYWSGMVNLSGTQIEWSQDTTTPFSAVGIADPNGAGPLSVSTDATGSELGPGTATLNANDVVCLPLFGRHLSIIGTTAGKPIYVALYRKPQPLYWGKC